jgi:hypothetical protein
LPLRNKGFDIISYGAVHAVYREGLSQGIVAVR